MTQTGRANRELRSKEKIERNKLLHDAEQKGIQRQHEVNIRNAEMKNELKRAKIGALGSIGGGIAKGLFSGKGRNDPAWYKNYIQDLEQFVRIPTYDRLGAKAFHEYAVRDADRTMVPGILTIRWIPTVGPQINGTSYFRNAVNQSLARTREKVLAMNSRSSVNWEPADLGFNFFCSADIATLITELGRVIKTYQTYHSKNAYFAKTLIYALGWDYSDIEQNFAEYRKQYTILARKFNSAIVAPRGLTLYNRRLFLANNVFIDTENPKNPRQLYVYVQRAAFVLAEDESKCTCLSLNNRRTLQQYVLFLQLMFSRITDSQDFIEMYADLRHAFGEDILQLPTTIENEELELNSDALNREQIHNLVIAPVVGSKIPNDPSHYLGFDLLQDTDGYLFQGKSGGSNEDRILEYSAVAGIASAGYNTKFFNDFLGTEAQLMCNMHRDDVSGDDILDITRGHFMGRCSVNADKLSIIVDNCGTEVMADAYITCLCIDSSDGSIYEGTQALGRVWAIGAEYRYIPVVHGFLSAFDWCPIVHSSYRDDSLTIDEGTHVDAYTTFEIAYDELSRIHEACVMSELYLPNASYKF